jgi:hypothetical protein
MATQFHGLPQSGSVAVRQMIHLAQQIVASSMTCCIKQESGRSRPNADKIHQRNLSETYENVMRNVLQNVQQMAIDLDDDRAKQAIVTLQQVTSIWDVLTFWFFNAKRLFVFFCLFFLWQKWSERLAQKGVLTAQNTYDWDSRQQYMEPSSDGLVRKNFGFLFYFVARFCDTPFLQNSEHLPSEYFLDQIGQPPSHMVSFYCNMPRNILTINNLPWS